MLNMSKGKYNNDKIDIIIPWVDGDDPKWQAERRDWQKNVEPDAWANSDLRFQNWNNLHYWFRSIEQNMSWFNKIVFVTWGHLPKFLNVNHPKLKIVKHEDYMPQKYLPTFNTSTIEMNFHRIDDLAENFVIFNDDMFPLQPIEESYYFQDNLVCDEAVEQPMFPIDPFRVGGISFTHLKVNDILFINRHFDKREVQKKNYDKWFSPKYEDLLQRNETMRYWYTFSDFHNPHLPSAMKKSTFKRLWEIEPNTLDTTSKNKFRSAVDINQYLARYWQLCEGNFIPRKTIGKKFVINMDNFEDVAADIRQRKWQSICLNEACLYDEFQIIKETINAALDEVFPNKSSFEM